MKVEVTARTGVRLLQEYTGTPEFDFKEEGESWVLEIPDSTEEFLKFIEPLGRFSIDLDRNYEGNLQDRGKRIVLFFENDYD